MKKEAKTNNLKYGHEIPFLTERVKFEAGTYKQGEIVEYVSSDKKVKKITTADKIYGIVCDDVVIDEKTTHSEIYLQGIFNKKEISAAAISDLDTVKEHARKLNIFFK